MSKNEDYFEYLEKYSKARGLTETEARGHLILSEVREYYKEKYRDTLPVEEKVKLYQLDEMVKSRKGDGNGLQTGN